MSPRRNKSATIFQGKYHEKNALRLPESNELQFSAKFLGKCAIKYLERSASRCLAKCQNKLRKRYVRTFHDRFLVMFRNKCAIK